MKIEAIDIFHVRMPIVEPWRTAYGSDVAIESVLVRMRGEGIDGWGESSPLAKPCYSPEYAGGVFTVLRDCFAPYLRGKEIGSGQDLQAALAIFKGNPFAKAALDTAWWDLHAKAVGKPLYRVLGGTRNRIEAGADFGIRDSLDELVEMVGEAVDSGVPRIKLKFSPHWGLPVIERLREHYPHAVLHIDCNAAYSFNDKAMFQELDRFGLAMFEQPLQHDDLVDHARLQCEVQTAICLDESINSVHKAQQAIALQACRWVNIKPGRVGGLTVAMEIHNLCETAGIPCWVGGMLESSVGAMHCAALSTLPNFKYAADLFPSSKFYKEDLSEPPIDFSSPWEITLPEDPGLGATPEPGRLKAWTVQQATFR